MDSKKKGRTIGLFHQFRATVQFSNTSGVAPFINFSHWFSDHVLRSLLRTAFTRVSESSGLLLVNRRMELLKLGVRVRPHPGMELAST